MNMSALGEPVAILSGEIKTACFAHVSFLLQHMESVTVATLAQALDAIADLSLFFEWLAVSLIFWRVHDAKVCVNRIQELGTRLLVVEV